jgi:hypothetical protein
MSKYVLNLTGKDWAKASPGDPHACLLAQGLNRQLGGRWGVAGHHATEFEKDGETIKRQLTLGSDAKSIMRWFDWLGVKTGTRATFYGSGRDLKPQGKRKVRYKTSPGVPLSMGQKTALTTAGGGTLLVVTGFWWVDAIAAAAAAVAMGGTIAVRRGLISIPKPAPSAAKVRRLERELPSWRQLRGMAPQERGTAYRRAVAAPEPLTAEPEQIPVPSVPVAPPAPPRPRWPVAAPRPVPGVSHQSAIPDHVPAELVREQARAQDRS